MSRPASQRYMRTAYPVVSLSHMRPDDPGPSAPRHTGPRPIRAAHGCQWGVGDVGRARTHEGRREMEKWMKVTEKAVHEAVRVTYLTHHTCDVFCVCSASAKRMADRALELVRKAAVYGEEGP